MNEPSKPIRGYYHFSESYYYKACQRLDSDDEITFGLYYENDGGTDGEMTVLWQKLGDEFVPELCVFNDAWKILHSFSDLLAEMAEVDDKNISPKEFCKLLDKCGFKDLTKRKSPYEN